MGLIKKFKAKFLDNCCSTCGCRMLERRRQLYMLPMSVGNYISHKEADYYREQLQKVNRKADIPTRLRCSRISMFRMRAPGSTVANFPSSAGSGEV